MWFEVNRSLELSRPRSPPLFACGITRRDHRTSSDQAASNGSTGTLAHTQRRWTVFPRSVFYLKGWWSALFSDAGSSPLSPSFAAFIPGREPQDSAREEDDALKQRPNCCLPNANVILAMRKGVAMIIALRPRTGINLKDENTMSSINYPNQQRTSRA